MILFKLKTGQILNLDCLVRISLQKDLTTKSDYVDLEFFSGLNVGLRDPGDIERFWDIAKQHTPEAK